MINVLVCGGRDYSDVAKIRSVMEWVKASNNGQIRIVTGGARGADYYAKAWAAREGIEVKEYPANWEKHGNAAGPMRNREMLEKELIGIVVAFPGGSGTRDMCEQAWKNNVPVIQVKK